MRRSDFLLDSDVTTLDDGSATDLFLDPIPGDFFQVRNSTNVCVQL